MEDNPNDGGQHISSTPNSLFKKEIERYKSMYEREREQFEEFQRYSKELEAELELELKQRDKKISELESVKHRMSTALEQIKIKSDKDRHESRAVEEQLRTRLLNSDEQCTELRKKLRAVEQQNDDLERRERIHGQQLIDLNERYDLCLERCAMLEAGMVVPQQQQSFLMATNGVNAAVAEHNDNVLNASAVLDNSDQQPMDFATSSVNNNLYNPSSTTETSPEEPLMRDRVQLTLNGRPSQQLIEQMLRKVEAAEAHLNSSNFSSPSISSFYDSPPATKTAAMNGLQSHFNGNNNKF